MKKSLLICLLVVVLCASMLFAACAPALEAETLEAMKEMLYQMYKEGNPANTYEVVGIVTGKGEKANVQWSVSVTSGDKNAVKVGSYDEKSKKVTIEVDPEPAADVAYTLTATLVNEKGKAYEIDGQPVSISFERSLKAFKINTYAEYLAACQANNGAGSDEQIRIKAYVIGVVCMSSSSKGSLYLQDAEGHGYYAYAPVDATKDCTTDEQLRAKWPIGTEVYVTGTVTTYNGQYEFNKNCEVVKTGKTVTDAELPYVDATAAFAAATSNEDTALAEYQNRRVELKGAIVTRISATGTKGTSDYKAYYYFTLPGSEVEFNVYYTIYFIDDATATAVCDKLVVGKQVDLKGIISVYSKDFQVYPDSANSVSNVRDVQYTDAERVAAAKKNLTLDSAITEPKSIDLPATGDLGTTITWAFAEGTTADFITIADGKLTVSALPAATTEVTVIATITSGSVSETKEFKVSVTASFVMSESHAYAGFVNQVKADKKLYLDGGVSGRYLTTTTDASKAVAIYAEAATNGYKLYILDGETKKYITIYSNADNKTSVNYDAAGTTVYVYNPVVNAFTSTFNGSEVYLGTYNTFDTISVSNLSYINAENTGVEQFPLELLPAADGATYSASLKQVKLEGKVLYLDGGVSGRYLTTTEDLSKAVVIYAEKVEGGYKFYKLNGTTKEYITVYANADGKDSVNYDAAGNTVFNYDPTVNAWTTFFAGKDKYLGTYNTFDTVSVSNLSYINAENTGVEQFPLEYNPVVAGGSDVPPAHECESVCPTCGKCLDKDCTEAACAEKCEGHEAVAAPVAGTYILSMYQSKNAVELYLVAEMDGFYIASTQNQAEAAVITLAKLDNGNYTMQLSTGKYLAIVQSGTHFNAVMQDTACEWAWNSTYNTLTVALDGAEYYLGTYGTYTTFGASNISYAATSYVAHLTAAGAVVPPVEEHKCESVCPECGKCLDKDCTEAACAEKCEGHEPVVGDATTVSNTIAKIADDNSWADSKIAESFSLDANITVSASCTSPSSYGRNTGKYYVNGENWRIYQNENPSVVISAANGATIVSVKITYASQNTGTLTLAGANIASGAVVTVNAASVTFGVGNTGSATNGQARITAIEVVYVGGSAPAHKCESVCPECGKCLDEDCAEAACADKCEGHPAAVVINGVNYSEDQAEEALLAIKADDVVVINTNGTIAKEYTFVAANYTIGEGAQLAINANAVAPAGAKLAVSAGSKIVVGAGATIDLSALTQEDFSTSTEARLVIAADAKVIMPAYTEELWNNKYLNAVIVAMVADSEVGAQLVLGETKLTKTASGWEAEAPAALEDVVINVSDITTTGEFTTEQVLAEGVTVLAAEGKSIKINSNNKSIDGFSFTQRLQLGGTMAQENRSIKVEIKGAATITIYAISSSSDEGQERNMLLKNNAFETVATQVVGLSICKVEYQVTEAGTYYLGSEKSGINVYYIAIAYEKAPVVPAHTCESVCEECGKCLDEDCAESVCAEKCEGHAAATVTASKTMAELITANGWTGSTTKQTFNLDENVTVKINGGSNTGKAYDGDHIRVYATDTPAGTITISVPEGYQLVSVKITTQTGTYAYLQVDGNSATDLSNTVVEVSGQSVVFKSVKNGSNGKQVRVMAMEVVYIPA